MAELAIRTAMTKLGGSLLERLLELDTGYCGPRTDCGNGHQAEFQGYRGKIVDTVLGPVHLHRAYYSCHQCHHGRFPIDQKLGVGDSSLSPGLRRMVARLGSQEAFDQAHRDLAELAGIQLTGKRVERSSEADGERVRVAIEQQAEAAISGKVVPLLCHREPIPNLYIAMDGTGVPTVPADTEGRRGKSPDGRAHTREVKLGCLFTQTIVDERGHPVRDPGTSSYIASMDTAAGFGSLLYSEARQRGLSQAQRVIALGDGAPWIWNLAGEHFPQAIPVTDLYHAKEHLHGLARLVFPVTTEESRGWLAARLAELDRGDIDKLLFAGRHLRCPDSQMEEVEKALGYFEANRQRMRYSYFRGLGIFVGSGAVEAGCRTVVAQRMKLSGMRWSVRGAAAIVSLRAQASSGPTRWQEIWQWLPYQTTVA